MTQRNEFSIIYTDRLPEKVAGMALGPVILIRPKYRGDKGLLEHEKYHRRRWLRTCFLGIAAYLLSQKYRLAEEVAAYKVQLKYSPGKEWKFAGFIAAKYRLTIVTQAQAHDLLLRR